MTITDVYDRVCPGVLVPSHVRKRDGKVVYWRRTCFVEERGLRDELEDVVYRDGKRPLQLTVDHVWPRSVWPDRTETHLAHLYCQAVQGGSIGSASQRLSGSYRESERRQKQAEGAITQANLRKLSGYYQSSTHKEISRAGGLIGGKSVNNGIRTGAAGRRSAEIRRASGYFNTPVWSETASRAGKIGNHNRWHTGADGTPNPKKCELCRAKLV
jgi:hypothetical protein